MSHGIGTHTNEVHSFRMWVQQQQEELKNKQARAMHVLVGELPQHLGAFVRNEALAQALIEYGTACRAYSRKEPQNYGVRTLEQVLTYLDELGQYWRGMVKISVIWPCEDWFDATFEVVE